MNVHLLGVRPVEFTNEKTGEIVEGITLYISYPDSDVYGVVADKKFISNEAAERLELSVEALIKAIGSDIDIMINPRGRLSGITICQKPEK